jgi:tetrahydromethanopterin S-methyltransferase subunit F
MAGPDSTLGDMRVDIGVIAEGMKGLTKMFEAFMQRTENCLSDHEGRLRAAELASTAIAQVADINARLAAVEKAIGPVAEIPDIGARVDAVEKVQLAAEAGWKGATKVGAIAGGVIGLVCGIVGAVVAVFTLLGGL